MNSGDLNRLPGEALPPSVIRSLSSVQRAKPEAFIKGPIPLRWVFRAVRLRKPALAAGLALWFMRGVTRSNGPIKITRGLKRRFQLSGPQMLRGLRALEKAQLIRFVRSGRGRCPVVEIIDLLPVHPPASTSICDSQPIDAVARSCNRAMIEG
jgi:hypothetical protein